MSDLKRENARMFGEPPLEGDQRKRGRDGVEEPEKKKVEFRQIRPEEEPSFPRDLKIQDVKLVWNWLRQWKTLQRDRGWSDYATARLIENCMQALTEKVEALTK